MGSIFSQEEEEKAPEIVIRDAANPENDPSFLILRNLDLTQFDINFHLKAKMLELSSDLETAAQHIKRIDLSVNKLENLPEEMAIFSNLEALIMNTNNLWRIPPQIHQNTSLTFLSLAGNDFSKAPSDNIEETNYLTSLCNLGTLSLSNSKISNLTPAIFTLSSLKILLLPLNRLSTFPDPPSDSPVFPLLQRFVLASNLFETIPPIVYSITNLTELYLNDNQITGISEHISNLVNLQTLNLSHNKLTTLPETIGALTLLKHLDLSRNELVHLPDGLCNLTAMEGLSLRNNKLIQLPEEIGNLSRLTLLLVSLNQLLAIPASVGRIPNLEQLDARGNQLTSIPESLSQLKALGLLALSGNEGLKEVPQSVLDLKTTGKLSCLDLDQLLTKS